MDEHVVVDVQYPLVVAPEGRVCKVDRRPAAIGRAAVRMTAPDLDALLRPLREARRVGEEERLGIAEPALTKHLDEAVALFGRHDC